MKNYKEKIMQYKKRPASFLVSLVIRISALLTFATLIFIILYILIKGIPNLKPSLFALNYNTENVSAFPAIVTTLYTVILSLAISIPLGLGCSIYLVEYAKSNNRIVKYIRMTTETLSGIPSIVYGLFGMLFFVSYLKWGKSLLSGSFTLAIMILPLIIRSSEEALKSVPDSFREASFGLGAGKLRTIFKIVLPSAIPGIFAGIILAIGRVVGESAALIYTAGTVPKIPGGVFESGRTLAIHMYSLSSEGLYTKEAYATAVILLLVVFLINTLAGFAAKKLTKQ